MRTFIHYLDWIELQKWFSSPWKRDSSAKPYFHELLLKGHPFSRHKEDEGIKRATEDETYEDN